MWDWRASEAAPGGVQWRWGFTAARPQGASAPPYESFNLGDHVGDDPAAVFANRDLLARDLDVASDSVLYMTQVHGAAVEVAVGPRTGTPPEADAMVTAQVGLALAVLVADCVPVLLVAPDEGLAGVAHAGRSGLAHGVVPAVVAALRDLGAGELYAVVGPSICGRCYEVPDQMRREVAAHSSVAGTVSWTGTPALDLAAGVMDQLTREGVRVLWRPGCTRESDHLFSYRRSGRTGRFAGVVVLDRTAAEGRAGDFGHGADGRRDGLGHDSDHEVGDATRLRVESRMRGSPVRRR